MALVFTAQWFSLGGMRCSPLNAALVRDWHRRLKIQRLLVSFPSFTPERACLLRSFRWHYMRSFRFDLTVYGF
ncbi:hypothetical protein D8T27_22655 [Vibrio vulnificus]|nr:hypothetical protein D8T27_22655 [Vibrio vulnificus]